MQLQSSFFYFLSYHLYWMYNYLGIIFKVICCLSYHTCNIQIKFILLYDSETIKYHVFIGYIVHITLFIFIAIVKQMICWCHQISILDFVMQYFLTQGHKKGISCFELSRKSSKIRLLYVLNYQNVEFVAHMIEYFFILLMMYNWRLILTA